jgi:ABC-2 type transport system ATP-binding protein
VFAEATEDVRVDGARVTRKDAYRATVEVDLDRTAIEAVVAQVVGRYAVADITVSEPPMEEVIAAIYRRRAEELPA